MNDQTSKWTRRELLRHGVLVAAYILAGVVVGPNPPRSLGLLDLTLVSRLEIIDVGAELGVVLLLFFLGLEFSPERLLARPTRLLGVGVTDFVVNFGVGLALAALFGFPWLTGFSSPASSTSPPARSSRRRWSSAGGSPTPRATSSCERWSSRTCSSRSSSRF